MTFLDENQRREYFATHYKNYHSAYYDQLYQKGIERANKEKSVESACSYFNSAFAKGFAEGYIDERLSSLFEMVSLGHVTVDEAAKKADMSPEEFALAKDLFPLSD